MKHFLKEINDIDKLHDVKALIIGLPLNMDGSEGKSAQSIRDKSRAINFSLNIPYSFWDERLSTVGAFNISSQLDINVSKREKDIDKNALETALQKFDLASMSAGKSTPIMTMPLDFPRLIVSSGQIEIRDDVEDADEEEDDEEEE